MTTHNPDYEIYNPLDKPIEDLPVIYGFNNGGSPGWYSGQLLGSDGASLGGHICSHEGFMYHDLGISKGSRPDRHEDFREHFPEGYRMDFVPLEKVRTHTELNAACKLNKETEGLGHKASTQAASHNP